MNPEDKLRRAVKEALAELQVNHPIHFSWVESHYTATGIPDLEVCCYSTQCWLELKAGKNAKIRPAQEKWFRERIAAGGFPIIIAEMDDYIFIIPGSVIDQLPAPFTYAALVKLSNQRWSGGITANINNFLGILTEPGDIYRGTFMSTFNIKD